MPKNAANRSLRVRRFSAGRSVTLGSIVLACTVTLGTAPAAHAAPAPAAVASTAPASYVVKPGDCLTTIATSRKVPGGWRAIAAANHLASPYLLYPGQVLKLPTGSPAARKTAAPAARKTGSPAVRKTRKTISPTAAQAYANNLDGWIRHSLAVMAHNGIPGTYNGIYRNVMRESSGNPGAINLWDSNAAAGTPSKGLLQVIQPTFNAYHVPGTSWNIYDPVANITAACNYAYHRYGSIDNVNGPY